MRLDTFSLLFILRLRGIKKSMDCFQTKSLESSPSQTASRCLESWRPMDYTGVDCDGSLFLLRTDRPAEKDKAYILL